MHADDLDTVAGINVAVGHIQFIANGRSYRERTGDEVSHIAIEVDADGAGWVVFTRDCGMGSKGQVACFDDADEARMIVRAGHARPATQADIDALTEEPKPLTPSPKFLAAIVRKGADLG